MKMKIQLFKIFGIQQKQSKREGHCNINIPKKLEKTQIHKLTLHVKELEKKQEKKEDSALELIYQQLEEKIKGIVGSKVAIRRKNKDKGRIEIEYYSQDELERIVELLESVR